MIYDALDNITYFYFYFSIILYYLLYLFLVLLLVYVSIRLKYLRMISHFIITQCQCGMKHTKGHLGQWHIFSHEETVSLHISSTLRVGLHTLAETDVTLLILLLFISHGFVWKWVTIYFAFISTNSDNHQII